MISYGKSSPGFIRSAISPRNSTRRASLLQYRACKASYRFQQRLVAARRKFEVKLGEDCADVTPSGIITAATGLGKPATSAVAHYWL